MGMDQVLTRLAEERDRLHEQIDDVLEGAAAEERDPSEAEKDLLARHKARLDQLEPQIVQLVEIEERRRDARDARAMVRRRETPPDEGNGDDGDEGDEGGEGEGYKRFAHYARDVLITRFERIGSQVSPDLRRRAAERLTRAPAQVLTTDLAGLTQPQYIAQIMQVIDASRPIVASASSIGLTAGKVQYPQITDSPDVAVQVTEKTEAGSGAMDVVMVETLAKTYLVAGNFSWQVVQWANPDAMELWFRLAARSYAKQTDAAAGAVLAAADAVPTAIASGDLAGWMAAIAGSAERVYTGTGRYVDTIYANPVDGYELIGMVSATVPTFLAVGQGNLAAGSFPTIAGLRMVVSAGIPAGQVIVGDSDALLCAESASAPVELRAIEPAIAGIEVGIVGAFACAITDPGAFDELTPPL